MREIIKDYVEIASQTLPLMEPVYEFGALQVPGQEGFADLRRLFRGKEYVGCDMREGPGVDRVLNLHNIALPSESVGTVLIMDTLEHVEFFREAVKEVHRILKPGGAAIVSSVMNFSIHNFPYDYWRFTPEGFKSLLSIFSSSFVDFLGEETFPHTVIGLGFKSVREDSINMDEFIKHVGMWKQFNSGASSKNWRSYVKPFTPPIVLDLYRKVVSSL
ncbi:MAG: class I SAM-dependent methyltransferase [Nitrospiraceae bacterium]|nr:MAG: class I SAM-dependent methyltransferase [Nitrospiraceae bacterium]